MKKSQMGILCFLVCVLGLSDFAVSQSSPDAYAMEALKSSLNLTSDVDWSDPNPCKWTSVQCDASNRVTRIQLNGKGIRGTLPPGLKNLTALTILEFFENQLSGPIPDLSGLSQLQRVLLRDNQFTSYPTNLFVGLSSLQIVYLDYNPFSSSEIPDSIKEATSIQELSLVNCSISGKIPDFLGTLPTLKTLHLSFNQLHGELPASFAGSHIQSLWLNGQSTDKLNGSISVLQNMTSLTQVWLHGNRFSGQIPDLSGLQSLNELNLRDNQLTGPVPESLVKLPSLETVNLTNNMLQGRAPKFADGVQVDMYPSTNSFCTDDPNAACDPQVDVLLSIAEAMGYPARFASIWKGNDPCESWVGITCLASNITLINLQNMNLTGTMSPSLAKLTSLKTIYLSSNKLTGLIPTELTTLPKLTTLDVSNNDLSGKVPSFRPQVVLKTEGNNFDS